MSINQFIGLKNWKSETDQPRFGRIRSVRSIFNDTMFTVTPKRVTSATTSSSTIFFYFWILQSGKKLCMCNGSWDGFDVEIPTRIIFFFCQIGFSDLAFLFLCLKAAASFGLFFLITHTSALNSMGSKKRKINLKISDCIPHNLVRKMSFS